MKPPQDEGPEDRLRVRDLGTRGAAADFAEDVRRGLGSRPKFLRPKYFYDALGSQLFEAICLLPEYYLTRAENEIFAAHSDEIVSLAAWGSRVTLLELGSGSATKTRRIIESLLGRQGELLYVPADISRVALESSSRELLRAYPSLRVEAYAGDYDEAVGRFGDVFEGDSRALVLFLGSNVGNFDAGEALSFLRRLRSSLREGDALLLGADLKKSPAALEAAYDDALGVTAAFNLNQIVRINREFGADFDPRTFAHVALYDEPQGRVEMHLESRRRQTVRIPALDLQIEFDAGERIHTENSYKYDLEQIARLAADAGFELARTWLDGKGRFSSNLLLATREGTRG